MDAQQNDGDPGWQDTGDDFVDWEEGTTGDSDSDIEDGSSEENEQQLLLPDAAPVDVQHLPDLQQQQQQQHPGLLAHVFDLQMLPQLAVAHPPMQPYHHHRVVQRLQLNEDGEYIEQHSEGSTQSSNSSGTMSDDEASEEEQVEGAGLYRLKHTSPHCNSKQPR